MENLPTIAEYSSLRGCSTTATYKRLETTLKPYVVVKNGMKYIKKEVLEDEGIQPFEPTLSTVANRSKPLPTVKNSEKDGVGTGEETTSEPKEPSKLDVMATVVKVLETQTASKDQEIDRLHKEIEELREQLRTANTARDEAERHNREQANKLAILLEQSQELQRNNQVLIANQQKAVEAPKSEPEEAMEDSQEAPADDKDAEIAELKAQVKRLEEATKPKGFLARLLGW